MCFWPWKYLEVKVVRTVRCSESAAIWRSSIVGVAGPHLYVPRSISPCYHHIICSFPRCLTCSVNRLDESSTRRFPVMLWDTNVCIRRRSPISCLYPYYFCRHLWQIKLSETRISMNPTIVVYQRCQIPNHRFTWRLAFVSDESLTTLHPSQKEPMAYPRGNHPAGLPIYGRPSGAESILRLHRL